MKCLFCHSELIKTIDNDIVICDSSSCQDSNVTYYLNRNGRISCYEMHCIIDDKHYLITYVKNEMFIDLQKNVLHNDDKYSELLNYGINGLEPMITPINYQHKIPMLLTFS